MGKQLDSATIAALLAPKPKPKSVGQTHHYPNAPQEGPLRYYDSEKACENSGYYAINEDNERYWKKSNGRCGSPSHWELEGVRYCMIHVVYKMNRMLMELGVGSDSNGSSE